MQAKKIQHFQTLSPVCELYGFTIDLNQYWVQIKLQDLMIKLRAESKNQQCQIYYQSNYSKDQLPQNLKEYMNDPDPVKLFNYLKKKNFQRISKFKDGALFVQVSKCDDVEFIQLPLHPIKKDKMVLMKNNYKKLQKQFNNLQEKNKLLQQRVEFLFKQTESFKQKQQEYQQKISCLKKQVQNQSFALERQSNTVVQLMKMIHTYQQQKQKLQSQGKNQSESIILSQEDAVSVNSKVKLSVISAENSKFMQNSINSQCLNQEGLRINHLVHLKQFVKVQQIQVLRGLITEKKLEKTQKIFLKQLKLQVIPPFHYLLNLKMLNLDQNNIKVIQNLCQLQNLQILSLFKNQITMISGVNHLHKLKILSLNMNKIAKIQNINRLRCLQQLDLSDNVIVFLSKELYEFKFLKNLRLSFNPIKFQDEKNSKIVNKLIQINVNITC